MKIGGKEMSLVPALYGFTRGSFATALIGWWTELRLLSNWGSGYSAVRPIAALLLAVFGLALVHPGKDSRFRVRGRPRWDRLYPIAQI
jgi:hypothetical protein